MKVWQIASVGCIAIILGCGGMGAYVPDGPASTGTPSQCAALGVSADTTVSVEIDSQTEDTITVFNGASEGLQSRVSNGDGDATVTFSVSGLPSGLFLNFLTNPVIAPLNGSGSTTARYLTDGVQAGTYTIQVTAQESGCTPITTAVEVTVTDNQGS
jgi:hypothetical protein